MDYEKEIPFGAFDSELMHQEIYIPEGFEATIDGNKIILTRKESEDEMVRKCLINGMKFYYEDNEEATWGTEKFSMKVKDILSWLEKQGEHKKFRDSIQVGDEVTRNRDGVIVNLSQLNRVAKKDEKQSETFTKRDVDDAYVEGMAFAKNELEKQGYSPIKWNKNTEGNKPQVNHSVLMKTTYGIAEGEWDGECWLQYRWSSRMRDNDVLSWIELSDF